MEYKMHCECYIDINNDEEIVKCELCEAAPDMYEFIKNIGLHLAVNYNDECEPYFIVDKEYLAEAHTITARAEGK